ncbi:uncharacterized protein LOC130688251 [Daphnia carinata]|uniref:uncharacterized protein LOC130688251 n=1 Tax=Daphnia carinata TaxID=120202 RepID=UPI00257C4456|nr:uncharacterized protein LOC130688251 [Daphnia carinata]XP_057367209.1 uncharacterized protein LOC130688251 [Daphnia carinata]
MAPSIVCKVTPVALARRDISWCFQPIFVWMRILGIDLNPKNHKAISIYGFLMLLVGTWAQFDNASVISWKLSLPQNDTNALNISSSDTNNWNIEVDYANHVFFMVIVSPTVFYVARNQWQLLWRLIVNFDSNFCHLDHNQLRKKLSIAVVILLLEISATLHALVVLLPDFQRESTLRKFLTLLVFFSKILSISSLVWYCYVTWLSSLFYKAIQQDIDHTCKVRKEDLRRWKCSLVLAGEVVNGINGCFGLILLISVTHFVVDFIVNSFYLVNNVTITNRFRMVIALANMLRKLTMLWFITCIPTEILQKASSVANSLRKINCLGMDLQNQVSFLALDILQSLPRISALGYFDINFELLPKMIGTTLTYVIILYQFQSSELSD